MHLATLFVCEVQPSRSRWLRLSLVLACLWSFSAHNLNAQTEFVIQGKVTNAETKQPLIGVTVTLPQARIGGVTDKQGNFRIMLRSSGKYALEARMIGFETFKRDVTVAATETLDIALKEKVSLQSDVVVVGYGQQERKVLSSAVTSISAKEVQNVPMASVDQMIQGRAAGVQIVSNSGTPGAGINVRVRGTTSITASNEPLYVIDGIPVVSRNLSQIGLGGQATNPMADINPTDIESIEVLKDASATAIYGARAANGVVLITTKRGLAAAKGEARSQINVNAYYGFQRAWKDPNDYLVDAPTFQALVNESVRNGNPNATLPYPDPNTVAAQTRWADLIFQQGAISNVDASIQGGVGQVKYFASFNNFFQEGITKRNTFLRRSGRLNLDFAATERLNIGVNVLYARTTRERTGNDNNINGAIGAAFFNPPNIPVRQPDGSFTKFSIFENPVAVVEFQDTKMNVNRLLANAYVDYNILDGLIFKSTFSVDYNNVKEDQFLPTQLNSGAAVGGAAFSGVLVDNNWIWENVLSYRMNAVDDALKINILAGNTIQSSYRERTQANGQQFPSNDFRRIASAAVQTSFSDATGWSIASFFGRASVNWQDKYFLDANVRYDGSSRFGANNRWGFFPSVGAGWNISEEAFIKEGLPQISTLKLRGSWGQVGNQEIPNFAALGLWTGGRNYADLPGTQPFQLANPNLKWETTTQTDIGFDLGLLENRINVTFDWYVKSTRDLLLNVELPRTTGFATQTQNIGAMTNRGVELAINAVVVKTDNVTWSIGLNAASNRAIIDSMATPLTAYTRDLLQFRTGVPMYAFWLHDQVGVDPQTGEALWRTVNGTGRLSDNSFNPNRDRFIVGDAQPQLFGGINSTLTFWGFEFNMFWQYSLGNKQLHWNLFFQEHGGTRNTQFSRSQLARWQNPGDVTMVPRMTASNYRGDLRPSRFLEDGSFVRLKNITLSYTLPSSLTEALSITNLRLYVQAQNLFTFTRYTGMDPELNSGGDDTFQLVQGVDLYAMPQPRTIMFGISATF
jgi:TonB-linked SusC/RagA family outer membrane protein